MIPAGYSWRRATVDDAAAILAFVVRHDIAIIGRSNCTLDDIRDQLTEPGLTIDADTWLVHAQDGTLAAWAWTYPRGDGEYIDLDVVAPNPEVRDWLYDQTLTRAAELARAGGHTQATLDIGIYRADEAAGEAAAAHGFHQATTFYQMRIDHGLDGAPAPNAPDGVILRPGPGDESFRRAAFRVLVTSFKGHFGFAPRSFEEWHERRAAESTFTWAQLTLAELGGVPVGILITSDRHLELENCGSVDDLGVLAEARGRGIATYLLQTAFAADRAAGRTGTILYVDSNNATGALGLYEGVGMRAVLVVDKWCRKI